MIKNWVLSNRDIVVEGVPLQQESSAFQFLAKNDDVVDFSDGCIVLINGYFVPRNEFVDKYEENQEALIYAMYKAYGKDFPKYGKGCYSIVIVDGDDFLIVSDRFGQIKHFSYEDSAGFMFSNSLDVIASNITKEIDNYSLAIHTLFCHYIGGLTLLKGVNYNDAGGLVMHSSGNLNFTRYDNIDRLYRQKKSDIPVAEIAKVFESSVADLISRLKINDVSLSLTGGMDTRNLLASLLKQGVKPHLYTYGNPLSEDSLRSQDISKGLKLAHALYDYKPNKEEFAKYAKTIIQNGQTLTSIHRVHRLWSVEQEGHHSKNMFLGTLGGEYVKGIHFNDYIISMFIEKYWDANDRRQLLKEELEKKYFNVNLIDLDKLVGIVDGQTFNQYIDKNENIFNVLSYITARTHDAQDINIYNAEMDYVFTPFLDIDYLEILFSSKFTFDLKNLIKKSLKRRLVNPIYSTGMIYQMYPQLAKYEYAGKYSPKEMRLSPYWAMVLKVLRTKLRKPYPENFPLTDWMMDFVKTEYDRSGVEVLNDVFDMDKMKKNFGNNKHQTIEAYWLQFTNIIHHRYEFEFLSLI